MMERAIEIEKEKRNAGSPQHVGILKSRQGCSDTDKHESEKQLKDPKSTLQGPSQLAAPASSLCRLEATTPAAHSPQSTLPVRDARSSLIRVELSTLNGEEDGTGEEDEGLLGAESQRLRSVTGEGGSTNLLNVLSG